MPLSTLKRGSVLGLLVISLLGLSFSLMANNISNNASSFKYGSQPPSVQKKGNQKNQATSQSAQLINQIVAIVNDGVITEQKLNQAVKQTRKQSPRKTYQLTDNELKRKTLNKLIKKRLALQLARKHNITVTASQVSNAIRGVAQKNNMNVNELKQQIKLSGVSYQDYRKNVQQKLLINKIQQQAVSDSVNISSKAIDQYLANQQKQNQKNQEYKLQHILLSVSENQDKTQKIKQKAHNIVNKIKKGKLSFSQAARKYSQSVDADSGGKLGWKTKNELPTVFAKKIDQLKLHEILGPYKASGAFHILYLKNIKQSKQSKHYVKQYQVSRIAIEPSPIMSADQAREKLKRIRSKIEHSKASFSQMAKQTAKKYADASHGGKIGWITPSRKKPNLAKQITSTGVGHISKPFKSEGYWQIIKIKDIRKKENTTRFKRKQAKRALFNQKAKQAVDNWMNNLQKKAYVKILDPALKNAKN